MSSLSRRFHGNDLLVSKSVCCARLGAGRFDAIPIGILGSGGLVGVEYGLVVRRDGVVASARRPTLDELLSARLSDC